MSPDRKLLRIPELIAEKRQFQESIIGQEQAVEAFAVLSAKIRSGIRSQRQGPIDIKFLAGPSGVGKTEIVLRLAEILGGRQDAKKSDPELRSKVIVINGGEYQESHAISKLIGSPPGYIGSEDARYPGGIKPILSQENLDAHKISYIDNKGEEQSVVIVLVDEAEKANIALHRAFLSVLDKGRMDLGNNKSSSFSNTVIFYTSNVGNEQVELLRDQQGIDGVDTDETLDEKAKQLMTDGFKAAFPPEFRGRIEELIIFEPLKPSELEKIAAIKLKELEEDFWLSVSVDIDLQISPKAMQKLLAEGYNPSEGARGLNKAIKKLITDQLALLQSEENLHRKTVYIDLSESEDKLDFYDVPVDSNRLYREKDKTEKTITPTTKKLAVPEGKHERPVSKSVEVKTHPDQGDESSLPRWIIDPCVTALREGIEKYITIRNVTTDVSMEFTAEQIGSDPKILEIAWDRILRAKAQERGLLLMSGNPSPSEREIEKLVSGGIGTHQYWHNKLHEHRHGLAS